MLCSGLGIDKVLLFGFIIFFIIAKGHAVKFEYRKITSVTFVFSYIFLISMFNGVFKPIVYYPFFGLIFVDFFTSDKSSYKVFYQVLFFYILISLIFGIASYFFGSNIFVTTMADKGLPFVRPLMGLTTTVQTFGTLCIVWLIVHFESDENKFSYRFFIVVLALIMTFNRTTYLLFFVVMSLYSRFFLVSVLILFLMAYIAFFDAFNSVIFNSSTLTSRSELLQGFYISFWNDNTLIGYLFGKADNFYSPEVVKMVKWEHRADIENLYAMVLHTYGFLGLFSYLVLGGGFVFYLLMSGYVKLSIISFFYLFVTQLFTQELVTNNFYLFLAVVMSIVIYRSENSNR